MAFLLLLQNVFNQVRVNSPAPATSHSQQAAASHLRRSQSAVVGLSRESEERGEERARREEKRREGDPLEEVRLETFSRVIRKWTRLAHA